VEAVLLKEQHSAFKKRAAESLIIVSAYMEVDSKSPDISDNAKDHTFPLLFYKDLSLLINGGFLSLDSESLGLAIITLINLLSNTCMIGIISHVSERKKRHAELIPKLLETAE